MRIQNGNNAHHDGEKASGHLARFQELKVSGEMPGLSLPDASIVSNGYDAEAPALNDKIVARLCEGIDDPKRIERFRETWQKAIGIARINRSGICESFPYDEFWSHSLACGLAAHALSLKLDLGRAEDAFLCGFLYRLGALALSGAFPFEYAELMELRSLSGLDELRSVERDLFGIDHVETTHALFVDLGVDSELCDTILRLTNRPMVANSPFFMLVSSAERIADLCMLDESQRSEEWASVIEMSREIGLERDEFTALGDAVVRQWWDCGDFLKIQTKAISSFLALDDTGILDRAVLGLGRNPAAHTAGEPLKVLVVDDDATARVILKKRLENNGYDVLAAKDGAEALSTALQHSPDVVVADWMMPEMDGLDLCRALRRYEDGRQLFFILLTGRDEDEGATEAFEAGVDDFITKPAKQGVLLARMTAASRVLELRKQVEEDRRLLKDQLCRLASLAREAKDAAVTDALTNLPNRRYANRRLLEELAYSSRTGQPFSILMMDVDRFKLVNDTYGHDVGDDVLQKVASVLEAATRKGEVACRFGGEEFLVICRHSSEREARLCGERIRAAIEDSVVKDFPFDSPVTVSIGVVTSDSESGDIDALVKMADQFVYQAKSQGRNQVCFNAPPEPLSA